MRAIFTNDLYELELPPNWDFQEDENVTSFFDSHSGVGALQISSYRVDDKLKIDLKQELLDFSCQYFEDIEHDLDVLSNSVREKVGYSYLEEDLDKEHWMFLIYRQKSLLLLITYNCDLEDKKKEDTFIWQILASLKIVDDQGVIRSNDQEA